MFSSDEETSALIRQVLAGLAIEEESCSEAVAAAQLITQQGYQFVIIDWDRQPEAGLLLSAGRERKASERPLTLAIVSDDASVPKALQAGANSVLRRPLLLNQVKDTLTTARDLVRARQESATAAAAAAAAAPATLPSSIGQAGERTLRAGEFLQPSASSSATQFDTESDIQKSLEQSAVAEVDLLKELEPMAAAVAPAPISPPPHEGPRGLQWFLNRRAPTLPPVPAQVPAPPPASNPELLGFDQMAATPGPQPPQEETQPKPVEAVADQTASREHREQKGEAELFAYMTEGTQPEEKTRPSFHIRKGAIIGAVALAACAIAAAPQAPWHSALNALWGHEQQALHAWLNPQPVTPVQAPESHENFGRAGDEYKLPVAETIPDATTDPSQIRVTPVVDPTAKKNNSANADQAAVPTDAANRNPGDQPAPEIQVKDSTVGSAPVGTADAPDSNVAQVSQAPATPPAIVATAQPQPDVPANEPAPTPVSRTPQVRPVANVATPPIPTSLKSQMASMTPEASGNKPIEAALPSIEPVKLPENTERALLIDQPALAYPPNAKGQRGTVVLEVLIGRDGTVEDAKFLQGSLAFARAAIDGAKQWKFKPYIMNARPVSVQTLLTITFDPKP